MNEICVVLSDGVLIDKIQDSGPLAYQAARSDVLLTRSSMSCTYLE
jgi:hypothetical protein